MYPDLYFHILLKYINNQHTKVPIDGHSSPIETGAHAVEYMELEESQWPNQTVSRYR
jgi:hypothetical protein